MRKEAGRLVKAARRGVSGWLAAAAIAAACVASSGAGAIQTGEPVGTHQTIDCEQSPHCIECGVPMKDGIFCCFADRCTIVNYPPQSVVSEPELEPLPTETYRPLGLGSYRYFRQ